MRAFARLLDSLAFTPSRNTKLTLVRDYLRETTDPERGWAVAALTGLWWLLGVSWMFGAGGVVMAVAGFAGWHIHPDWLVAFLT